MAQGIGAAKDFYRLRLMRVDDADAPVFDWREDILWRRPEVVPVDEREVCRVEAVSLDDSEHVIIIGTFECSSDAYEALSSAEEELDELTRSEFEDRYFPADV